MNVSIQLYGAFRQFQQAGQLRLACPGARSIADVRAAFDAHAGANWSGYHPTLLRTSAFASATCVLRDSDPVPGDGQLVILPPVSGG